MYKEYLCMDCENYLKCPANSGIETEFLKNYERIWLETRERYFLKVHECDKFIQKDIPKHEKMKAVKTNIRICKFCGQPFEVNKYNKRVCGNLKCKLLMMNTRA